MISITSCANNLKRLDVAAKKQGVAKARVNMPEQPADCRVKEAHATLTIGAEPVVVLRKERTALDRANARITRCADNYDNVRSALR